MQERLKEMLLVQWPVTDGRIAAKDLEKVLRTIGYDYLITPESINKIKSDVLCKEQKDTFH
jgi:Ca2+-binding EF-hand superfamily protein